MTVTLSVSMQATEVSDPSKEATATVTIEILDVNDNVPMFEEAEYSANVTEGLDSGDRILQVTASDRDHVSQLETCRDTWGEQRELTQTRRCTPVEYTLFLAPHTWYEHVGVGVERIREVMVWAETYMYYTHNM